MPDETPEVDLRPDGTVRLLISEKTETRPEIVARLRRPLIGELRVLQEELQDIADQFVDGLHDLPASPERPVAVAGETQEEEIGRIAAYRIDRARARDLQRKWLADADLARVAWTRHAFELLSDTPLPDVTVGQLPQWAGSAQVAIAFVAHWQTVPLSPGGDS